MRSTARLRRKLIISHLAAIVITMVSMVLAVVLIASSWVTAQANSSGAPAQEARIVARAIGGIAARGGPSPNLDIILEALARGDLRVLNAPGAFAPEQAQSFDWFGASLASLSYIVVIGRDGQPLASSEPGGAAFAPPERPEWRPLTQLALTGVRDLGRLAATRSAPGPAALGAYPVLDEKGNSIGAVLVAARVLPSDRPGFWPVGVFGAASLAILAVASLFALVPSSIIGYLLSRRLVARLERLGQASDALAAGDLTQRVDEGSPDEVGLLVRRFNHMADRVSSSVSELEAAKGRTEAALRAKRELVLSCNEDSYMINSGHVQNSGADYSDRGRTQRIGVLGA